MDTTLHDKFCELINENSEYIGDIVEFGTGSGYSGDIIASSVPNKKFITFDGFVGLPKTNKVVPMNTPWAEGQLKFDYESTKNILSKYENVTIWRKMSWELNDPSEFNITELAAANFDFDLYEGTLDGLRFIQKAKWNKILVRFDDWGAYNFQKAEEVDQHEKAAFYDWIKETGYEYTEFTELTKFSQGLQSIFEVRRSSL